MMIVIPYREDVHKGLELRFALRSIDKYLKGWTEVIVIGRAPTWYIGKSYYVPDHSGRKEYSIYNKLLRVETENFVMWNDDHFLLKPLDVTEIKYWHNGSLRGELQRKIGGRYRLVIQKTLEEIPAGQNFDIHVPIIYNRDQFGLLFNGLKEEICIKSYYTNKSNIKGEFIPDLKIDGQFTKDEIKDKIQNRLFFSTGTNLCPAMVEVLNELYQEKCKFEI